MFFDDYLFCSFVDCPGFATKQFAEMLVKRNVLASKRLKEPDFAEHAAALLVQFSKCPHTVSDFANRIITMSMAKKTISHAKKFGHPTDVYLRYLK